MGDRDLCCHRRCGPDRLRAAAAPAAGGNERRDGMTREDVIAIAGSLEDRFIVEILDAGGDRADLIEAVARARGEPLDFPAAPRPMSATVSRQIGRAHVRTPVTNAPPVCRPLLETKPLTLTHQNK